MAKNIVPPYRGRKRMPINPFGANLRSIETVGQAQIAVAGVFKYVKNRKRRLYALTVLLNRAALARNPEPFELIDAERRKIILASKPRGKAAAARPAALLKVKKVQFSPRMKEVIRKTNSLLRRSKRLDSLYNFILELSENLPKNECGTAADYFVTMAAEFEKEARLIKDRKKRDDVIGAVSDLYFGTELLYEKAGLEPQRKAVLDKSLKLDEDLKAGH